MQKVFLIASSVKIVIKRVFGPNSKRHRDNKARQSFTSVAFHRDRGAGGRKGGGGGRVPTPNNFKI